MPSHASEFQPQLRIKGSLSSSTANNDRPKLVVAESAESAGGAPTPRVNRTTAANARRNTFLPYIIMRGITGREDGRRR